MCKLHSHIYVGYIYLIVNNFYISSISDFKSISSILRISNESTNIMTFQQNETDFISVKSF